MRTHGGINEAQAARQGDAVHKPDAGSRDAGVTLGDDWILLSGKRTETHSSALVGVLSKRLPWRF